VKLNLAKTVIFTVLVPGTVGVYVPYRLRAPGAHAAARLAWLGLPPILIGTAMYLWCAWDFATVGRGTPLPLDAPRILVVRGLYRYVRNPMYVGVLLVILGQALFFGSVATLWYAMSAALFFHLFVLLYEEPALSHQFGESYTRYVKTVPRWIPRPAAKPAPAK
jgi:protein-S-isoprenylcysteine O-methyltransferase Ste14